MGFGEKYKHGPINPSQQLLSWHKPETLFTDMENSADLHHRIILNTSSVTLALGWDPQTQLLRCLTPAGPTELGIKSLCGAEP